MLTKTQLAQAAQVLTTTYDRDFDRPKLELWFSMLECVPVDQLVNAIQKHIADPDQGRFFPTPAHILKYLVKGESQIKLEAGQSFDANPTIDGTDSWTAQNEDQFSYQQRRREYIKDQWQAWQELPFEKKLQYSRVITEDQADAITNQTKGLNHESK